MKTIALTILATLTAGALHAGGSSKAQLDPTPELDLSNYTQKNVPFLVFKSSDGSFLNTYVEQENGMIEFVEWRRTEDGEWHAKTQTQLNKAFKVAIQSPSQKTSGKGGFAASTGKYRRTEDGRWELVKDSRSDAETQPVGYEPMHLNEGLTQIHYRLAEGDLLEIENDNADISLQGDIVKITTHSAKFQQTAVETGSQPSVIRINHKLEIVE